jgi:hypothetical protein
LAGARLPRIPARLSLDSEHRRADQLHRPSVNQVHDVGRRQAERAQPASDDADIVGTTIARGSIPRPDRAHDSSSAPQSIDELAIAPTPSTSTATLRVTTTERGLLDIALFDVRGAMTLRLSYDVDAAGTHDVPMDVSGLSDGMYTVRVSLGTSHSFARLVVVHDR